MELSADARASFRWPGNPRCQKTRLPNTHMYVYGMEDPRAKSSEYHDVWCMQEAYARILNPKLAESSPGNKLSSSISSQRG